LKIRKRAVLIVLVLLVAYFFPYDFAMEMLNDLLVVSSGKGNQCIANQGGGLVECASGSDRISSVVLRWGLIPTFGSPLANMLSFQHFLALLAVSFLIFNIGAGAEPAVKPEEWEWEET